VSRSVSSFQSIRQIDGRNLDVLVGGATSGPALVCHHGSPSDASLWLDWDGLASEHGLRLIAISRPGYATSTRQPRRNVADVADDVRFVLDTLDVPCFVTVGWSGGGPHALACAVKLGDRCRGVATLAGVGPFGDSELDFLAGMGPENHAEFGAALKGESCVRAWLEEHGAAFRRVTGAEIAEAFGGLVPQIDRDVLAGGFADAMAAEMRRALALGFDGWVDDDMAFTRPWGFNLSRIAVPVVVWQGDLDLMVPFAHGKWLVEMIPGAVSKPAIGHGHISLFVEYRDAIVRDLMERVVVDNNDG
jgi:pimeloyl-ACP methyl ester carboxylesterase